MNLLPIAQMLFHRYYDRQKQLIDRFAKLKVSNRSLKVSLLLSPLMSANQSSSDSEVEDLISSCTTASATLHKLLPVKIRGHTVMALVDSGNSFYNALSLAVAKRINLSQYQPYKGSPVGTASIGSNLDIVGIIPSIAFNLTDHTDKEHPLTSRHVIIKHLSCGLNSSLPFMVEHGLDQLHSQGIFAKTQKNVRFPLYQNINHARRRLKEEKVNAPQINVIILGDRSATVSSKLR